MGINLGEDAASASLQVSGAVLEKIFALLAAIAKKGKEQADIAKSTQDKTDSTRIGRNKLSRMIKTKEDIIPLGQTLTKEQMKLFGYYAKKYGISYAAVGDKYSNEKIIMLKKTDLERAVAVSEKVLENSKLKEFAKKNENNPEFVEKVIDGYIQDTYQEMNMKGMTFNEALNRITDRDFSRDKPYFVVERNNPENFIMLKSYLDNFRGKEYTATDYTVYKEGQEYGRYSDRRFEGRDKNFWANLKKEMKAKGGFSDDVVILNSRDELENYKRSFKEHVAQRSKKDINFNLNISKEGLKDYESIITGLRERSKVDFIQDISTGAMVPISESEKKNINKQIKNYEKMEKLQEEINYNKSQFITNSKKLENGSADENEKLIVLQSNLEKKIAEDQVKMDGLLKLEADLKHEEGMILTNDILTGLYREEVAKRYQEGNTELLKKAKELGIDEEGMINRPGDLLDDTTKRGMAERIQEIKRYRMNSVPEGNNRLKKQQEHSESEREA